MLRRHTLNIDEDLLREAAENYPGLTKTAIVDTAIRALLANAAAERLAQMEGVAPDYQPARRSAWNTEKR